MRFRFWLLVPFLLASPAPASGPLPAGCLAPVLDGTRKDFGAIAADYDFFVRHATEEESVRKLLVRRMNARSYPFGAVRFLDFGAGKGQLSEYLEQAVPAFRRNVHFAVVEPDGASRAEAVARLNRVSLTPVAQWDYLPAEAHRRFDVILANHVFYYVPDVLDSLQKLRAHLVTAGGVLYLTLANDENALNHLSQHAFMRINSPWPFHRVQAVEEALKKTDVRWKRHTVSSEVVFPDSPENRMRILRFMHAQHLRLFDERQLLADFEGYRVGKEIVLPLIDHVYEIEHPSP